MKAAIAALALAITLAGCDGTNVNTPQDRPLPAVKAEKVEKKKEDRGGPGFCVICVGPHFNFGSGKFGIGPSIGPGISLF
jgi:hypothetical protein